MIKVEDDEVMLQGSDSELIAEFTMALRQYRKNSMANGKTEMITDSELVFMEKFSQLDQDEINEAREKWRAKNNVR